MAATGDFRLSITRALGDQLGAALEALSPVSLVEREIGRVADRGGVYQLFHRERLVYIGKAEASVAERLRQHRRKISGRENIHLDDMSFVAIYVDEDLSAVAPETLLINLHREAGAVPWNFNGFGNKDPGKERDTSRVDPTHFDALYPANVDLVCDIDPGTYLVGDLLSRLKATLPYVLRYKDGNRRRALQPPEYWQSEVIVPRADMTASELFQVVASGLPNWQVTFLPGYVIVYPERRAYASARREIFGG